MATTNPLTELIPAKARKYVYGIVFLAAIVFSIYQASEGSWEVFVGGVITALVNALALSNTVSPESDEALQEHEAEADETDYAGQHVADDDEPYLDGHSTV